MRGFIFNDILHGEYIRMSHKGILDAHKLYVKGKVAVDFRKRPDLNPAEGSVRTALLIQYPDVRFFDDA